MKIFSSSLSFHGIKNNLLKNPNKKKRLDKENDLSKVFEWLAVDFEASSNSEISQLFEAVFLSVIVDSLDPEDLQKYIESSEEDDFESSIKIFSKIPDLSKKVSNRFYFEINKSISGLNNA